MKTPKDKIRLNKVTHSVRAAQAVLQYGVGAMVDFPDQTLMTAAPEYWKERVEEIHDERLEKVLHVDYFGMPGNRDEAKYSEGISYVRFPQWYFCPKCRRFQSVQSWVEDYRKKANPREIESDPYMVKHMKCPVCKQDLVVARIVTVCEKGHIDDFPWVKWVHCQNISGAKKICTNPKLTFKTGASSTEGLEGLEIYCESCHAKATLKGAFDPGKFERLDKKHGGEYKFTCSGKHPWKNSHEACECYPKVLQRGSSSVYFPVISSSLVIPPYSNELTTSIEASRGFEECKTTITNSIRIPGLSQEVKIAIISGTIDRFSENIALEIGKPEDKIKVILQRKWLSPEVEECSTSGVKYRAEEYEALSGEMTGSREDYGDFLRESTDISDYKIPFVKNISLIHKIREVQALTGFSRIRPAERTEESSKPANIVSVKASDTNWYPAYQVRGEGIFIEFDGSAINRWAERNEEIKKRIYILNENYKKSFIGSSNPRTISAKFVLLHTISHLLIKQLSFECGYNIASLKERLYCSDESEGKEMSGILIYTASGDSEGTLGGLVRQGRPDVFPRMFKKAIESAMMCSNDPVCSLSMGQGRDSLNLAACYSCTLIPETSCEEFNVFLDRAVVVGTFDNNHIGFYSNKVYEENGWKIEDSVSGETVSEENRNRSLIINSGTDMNEVSYNEIWDSLMQWSENEEERRKLKEIIGRSSELERKEKPLSGCEFMLSGFPEMYSCDLIWKRSKVAFFTEENECDCKVARESDWKCFCSTDDFSVDELFEYIKEV